jgi:AraC family ethanolamine operon transcriptional activator
MYVVSFPAERIEASAARLRLPIAVGRLLASGVHRSWPGLVDNLRTVCRRIDGLLQSGSNTEQEVRRVAAWSDDLLDLLLLALVNHTGVRKPSPMARRRSKAFDRALEVIEEMEGEPVSLSDLCRYASVSERTLQYAFRERLSVTPKEYIQLFRLNRVRGELRTTAARDVLISDIANQFGFWHLGQFAADYRKFFGELPSETPRST